MTSTYPNVYWDSSSKGSGGTLKTKYHACWRVEVFAAGKRYKLGRFACEHTAGQVAASFRHQLGLRPATPNRPAFTPAPAAPGLGAEATTFPSFL